MATAAAACVRVCVCERAGAGGGEWLVRSPSRLSRWEVGQWSNRLLPLFLQPPTGRPLLLLRAGVPRARAVKPPARRRHPDSAFAEICWQELFFRSQHSGGVSFAPRRSITALPLPPPGSLSLAHLVPPHMHIFFGRRRRRLLTLFERPLYILSLCLSPSHCFLIILISSCRPSLPESLR